ncbi:asparagine synthase (glutamine-hydrolyzing) [Pseudomonas aeruginosa]|nr:asparagine synthase (glutamine-hydrolyzing) [Pseudomonas aeruginosa]
MCGLVGWISFSRNLQYEIHTVNAMNETLRSRGPDDGGIWYSKVAALAHRRLSLIDFEGGRQPMVSALSAGQVVLVYTGEVYNFQELRTQLVSAGLTFRTRSDTEVVLNAYLHWGEECVTRFRGMFAFAIWDERAQRLLLGRDRLGVKPLYYHVFDDGVLFASEPKAILRHPSYVPDVELKSLHILLQPRLTLPGETAWRGICEVPAAHTLSYDRWGVRLKRYWQLHSEPHHDDYGKTVEHVKGLLEEIVKQQVVADVPCSTMLSGGLDSTAITALVMETTQTAEMHSFCIGFDTDNTDFAPTHLRPALDTPYADIASRHLGTQHRTVTITDEQIDSVQRASCLARDLPSLGQFDASMFLLCKNIATQGRIALSGEAADEIFGGYPLFHDEQQLSAATFPWLRNGPRLTDYLVPEVQQQLQPREFEHDRYAQVLASSPKLPGENAKDARVREALYLNMQGPLAVILDRKDRLSMAHGLEVRVPFCDHVLIEYMWNVPWDMKCQAGVKGILKDAMRSRVPNAVLERKKSAYPSLHSAPYLARFFEQATQLVTDQASPFYGLFDRNRYLSLIERMKHDKSWVNAHHMLIPLIETHRWMKLYNLTLR